MDYSELVDFLNGKFLKVEERFTQQDEMFKQIDLRISQLPTKAYVDNKIADLKGELKGEMVAGFEKTHAKIDRITDILKYKNIITDSEHEELGKYRFTRRV